MLADKNKLVGDKAIAAVKLCNEFEKFFHHSEIGEIKREAYGIVFIYESGNQKSFDLVTFHYKITGRRFHRQDIRSRNRT